MTDVCLSEGEKIFILHGVHDNCRQDGRRCLDYRQLEIETNVNSNCHGSGHVRLGSTDVLVGIKVELGEPEEDRPNEGKIEFFADFSANASPAFEGYGGEETVNELVAILNNAITPTLNLKSLCVIPGKSVWTIYIDILILEFESKPNLFDACGVAIKAALFDTKIPKVTIEAESEELELAEDPAEIADFDLSRVPLFVTLTRISGNYVVDATPEEEAASISSIILAIEPNGDLSYTKKMGSGTLFADPLKDILPKAKELATDLHKDVLARLNQEQAERNEQMILESRI